MEGDRAGEREGRRIGYTPRIIDAPTDSIGK